MRLYAIYSYCYIEMEWRAYTYVLLAVVAFSLCASELVHYVALLYDYLVEYCVENVYRIYRTLWLGSKYVFAYVPLIAFVV